MPSLLILTFKNLFTYFILSSKDSSDLGRAEGDTSFFFFFFFYIGGYLKSNLVNITYLLVVSK